MHQLCTYFDRGYLAQGLALIRSLERTSPGAVLWVLCLDAETQEILRELSPGNVRLLSVEDLLAHAPELGAARADRSRVEFYYACTPRLVEYVLDMAPEAPGATYVDADMFFFRDCLEIYAEAPDANVLIVPHRSGNAESEAEHGRFNVCIVHFARAPEALRCLGWWAESTLRSTALGNSTWGEQKYLDEFPERFDGVGVLTSPAVTSAPWNIWRHGVRRSATAVLLDDRPLTVYHFARLLLVGPHAFIPIRRLWLSRTVLELVYRPYMQALRAAYQEIRSVRPGYRVSYTRRNLRGVLLGAMTGRFVYEGRLGMRRLGIWIPSGPAEWKSRQRARAVQAASEEVRA